MENMFEYRWYALIGIEIVYGVYKSHFGRFWRQVILGLEKRFITSGVTGRPDDNF